MAIDRKKIEADREALKAMLEQQMRTPVSRTIREYVLIAFGLLLYSVAWKFMVLPFNVVGGGVTGICALIYYATKGVMLPIFGTEGIPVFLTTILINGFLLIAAVNTLGWKFCVRTIYGVSVLALWLAIIPEAQPMTQEMIDAGIKQGTMLETGKIALTIINPNEVFMACVVGGLMAGLGIGIVFLNNGTSGGTDIITMILNKYRHISLGRGLFLCDIFIIISSILLPDGSVQRIVQGLVLLLCSTTTIDNVVNGTRQSVQFFIFSTKYEEIATAINIQVNRGVTILDGMGWYSKQPMKVVTVLARKSESAQIFRLVKNIDPNAFVSQSAAIGVYGKGFDVIDKNTK